jgi:hypothetical protein
MPQPFLDFLCARLAGIPDFVFVMEGDREAGGDVGFVIRWGKDRNDESEFTGFRM